MDFNKHSHLAGNHAHLSPSKPHWLNYDDDKIERSYFNALEAQNGVEMHEIAYGLIRKGVKLPDIPKTINMYVNDGIGWRMVPEQMLFYSVHCFGTADTISFRKNVLRISDLKMGVTETHVEQLQIYAGLFCLEYKIDPFTIKIELRIYQNDEVRLYETEPDVIAKVMSKIRHASKIIQGVREEVL